MLSGKQRARVCTPFLVLRPQRDVDDVLVEPDCLFLRRYYRTYLATQDGKLRFTRYDLVRQVWSLEL